MSDPSLVQITFRINPDMPVDMKRVILGCFTDYYTKYYPEKLKDINWKELYDKYPAINDLYRNDAYHNVCMQVCQLDEYYVYDIDTNKFYSRNYTYFIDEFCKKIPEEIHPLGVSITTLPKCSEYLYNFFKLVGPYISSCVSTLGICHHTDYGTNVSYFYQDSHNNIREHIIEIDENQDNIVYDDKDKCYNNKCDKLRQQVEDLCNSNSISPEEKDQIINDLDKFGYNYVIEEYGL